MGISKFCTPLVVVLIMADMVACKHHNIPTTLEGPFKPKTRAFDPSLRRGSDDLPLDDPRLKRNVTADFPEQIALAISSPTAMWVSWITGMLISHPFLDLNLFYGLVILMLLSLDLNFVVF